MDRYTDRTQLGVSKSGPVFRATDSQTGQPVLIKLLPADGQAAHPCDTQGLLQLAPQLLALNGFNIAKCVDIAAAEGGVEVVSEFITGPTGLQHPEKGKMNTGMATDILNQLLNAIADGERLRMVHGDLKPSNVLFGTMADGRAHVKVTDWALAQLRESQAQETLLFMAPERLEGGPPTVRSDLFTAGATLYFLLTGFTLVTGRGVADIQAAWSRAVPDQLKKIRKDINSKLVKVVLSLLEMKPEKRPGSAAEAMRALAELKPPALPQPAAPARQPGSATQPIRPGHITQPMRPGGPSATQPIRPGHVTQPMRPGPTASQPIRPAASSTQPIRPAAPVQPAPAPVVPIVPLQPPPQPVVAEQKPPTSSVPVVAMRPPPQIAAQLNLPEPVEAEPVFPSPQQVPPMQQYSEAAYAQPAYSQPAYPQPAYPQPAYQQPAYPQQGYPQQGYPQQGYPQPGMPPQMAGGHPGLRMTGVMMPRRKPKSKLPLVIGLVTLVTVAGGGFFLWKMWSDKKAAGGAEAKSGPPPTSGDLQAKMRAAADRQKAEKEAAEKEKNK